MDNETKQSINTIHIMISDMAKELQQLKKDVDQLKKDVNFEVDKNFQFDDELD